MEVYIVRHTNTSGTKGICYGQSEVDLAPTFQDEAKQLQRQLPSTFDAVFTSPLTRCTQLTATLGFDGLMEPGLMEVNFGQWEGTPWKDIPQTELDPWMKDFVDQAPPSGECLKDMYLRIAKFWDQLRSTKHKNALVICHAGVIRCTWAYLLNIPLNQVFKIPVGFGEVMKIHLGDKPELDAILQHS